MLEQAEGKMARGWLLAVVAVAVTGCASARSAQRAAEAAEAPALTATWGDGTSEPRPAVAAPTQAAAPASTPPPSPVRASEATPTSTAVAAEAVTGTPNELTPPLIEASYEPAERVEVTYERNGGAAAGKGAVGGALYGGYLGGLSAAVCGPLVLLCAIFTIPAGAAVGLVVGAIHGLATAPEISRRIVHRDELPPEPLRGELAAILDRRAREPAVLAALEDAAREQPGALPPPRIAQLTVRLTGRSGPAYPARMSLVAVAAAAPGAWSGAQAAEVLPDDLPAASWAEDDGARLAEALARAARLAGAGLAAQARAAAPLAEAGPAALPGD